MPNERRRKRRRRGGPPGPPADASRRPSAAGELRPNKPCPRCGAENIATADRCIACGAAFQGVRPPSMGVGSKIGKKDPEPSAVDRPATWKPYVWQRNAFRVLGVAGCNGFAAYVVGRMERGGAIALVVVLLVLAISVLAAREVGRSRAEPGGPPFLAQAIDLVVCFVGLMIGLPFLVAFVLIATVLSNCCG